MLLSHRARSSADHTAAGAMTDGEVNEGVAVEKETAAAEREEGGVVLQTSGLIEAGSHGSVAVAVPVAGAVVAVAAGCTAGSGPGGPPGMAGREALRRGWGHNRGLKGALGTHTYEDSDATSRRRQRAANWRSGYGQHGGPWAGKHVHHHPTWFLPRPA